MQLSTLFLSVAALAGMVAALPTDPQADANDITARAWGATCVYPGGKCDPGQTCVLDPFCLGFFCVRDKRGRCF